MLSAAVGLSISLQRYIVAARCLQEDNVWLVPPVATLLVKSASVRRKHAVTLRSICCGAAPLAAELVQQLRAIFPGVKMRHRKHGAS